ncbi:hypothetical protein [Massilia sp. Se16.2.3]|uniref:hypothetical protein n=1 Tax=Massilia sp. Se16.2.3 TaxID=2709303 RepID=UPI001600761C|nr:hypothetical protein [Massilia sp. Se16.2.3]QNA97938.1 hypothetical protein G4G31_02350 [Massilia sp. Se16.2.3]
MLPDSSTPAPGGLAGLAGAFAFIALLGWAALRPTQPPLPAPKPATAPAPQFSAGRAAVHRKCWHARRARSRAG